MENNIVSLEIAQQEIDKWLDVKRIKPSKREKIKETIQTLVDAVSDGVLVLNENNCLVQKLEFPIKNDGGVVVIDSLTFKNRLTTGEINTALKGVGVQDFDGRLLGYIHAATDQPKGILSKLDSVDASLANNIMTFFM